MTIETLNLGDHVSARLINREIVTGIITNIKVDAYQPGEGYEDVTKIYYTLQYNDSIGIRRKKVVREYEIIDNESK